MELMEGRVGNEPSEESAERLGMLSGFDRDSVEILGTFANVADAES